METQQEETTYIALFHHRDNAAAAIRDLETAGFSTGTLTIIGGNGSNYSEAHGQFGSDPSYSTSDNLSELGVPDRDRKHLQDGINEGGTLLVLKGAGDRADEIETIFHKHSTGKIDETDVDRAGSVAPAPVLATPVAVAEDAMVIPVTEERLVVGKREVDRGGVRVFRRIVEEPVTESVSLHEEHVVIDRRPVNRAVTDADMRQGDQTLELMETAEEAVVGKTAHVVEEVHVGKQAMDHTEMIRDTVRHTEVDVEQIPSGELTDTTFRKQ